MVLFKGQIKYSELKSCSLWTQMPAFSLSSKLARYAAEWKSEKQFLLQHIRLSKYSHHARIRPPYFSGFRIAAVLWQGTGEEKGALLRAGYGAGHGGRSPQIKERPRESRKSTGQGAISSL